jgi:osmoprotectant transport system ATP-binding protein
MQPADTAIAFRRVSYQLPNGRAVLQDLTFEIPGGEILVLLGRSGSGKTTALKLVNRLLEPSSGEIVVHGRSTRDWDTIELRRHTGYAIQEVGLFPHYSVGRNIALLPEIEHWPKARIAERVDELLKLVGLRAEITARYPHQLSGGQRQRVGVARALAADPPLLLMDEPFGALDPLTRADLQHEFLSLQQKLNKTVVFVTHDVREALLLGTRIALLEDGKLVSCESRDGFLNSSDPLVRRYLETFGEISGKRGPA